MTIIGSTGFAARLAQATSASHVEAERSGVIADLLRGRGSVASYAALLHNLLPAYQALESGLERHRGSALLAPFARPEVYRSAAIIADLAILGHDPATALLPEGRAYAAAVVRAGEGDGVLLVAHAYTRTLGDLSGGQIVQKLLSRSLGDIADRLGFGDFPLIADLAACKSDYRAALAHFGSSISDMQPLLDEAVAAFGHNIAVSRAVSAQFSVSV